MTNKEFYKRIGCVCAAIVGLFLLFVIFCGVVMYLGYSSM